MSIKRLSPEELLALDRFAVDEGNPHILVDKAICATLHGRGRAWWCARPGATS